MTDMLPLVIAALAAGAILLIFVGLAGGSPVDPVQARLTQLGTMQAKNLEELELQQPFIERTLRPLVANLSSRMSRAASSSFTERTEKRLALEHDELLVHAPADRADEAAGSHGQHGRDNARDKQDKQ